MKKNRRKRSKNKSTWFFRVIAIISIIIFIVFGIMLYVLDMIPFKFLIIFYIVFGLLYLYLFITSFPKKIKNKFRISSCVFLILFGTIFGVGIKYLNDTMDFVGIISKDLLQKEVYYVMTLDSSTIKNVKDLSNLNLIDADFSSRCRTAQIGDAVAWKNINGYYAVTKIVSIKDDNRGDTRDELECQYVIFK